jgi:hypothetical protein
MTPIYMVFTCLFLSGVPYPSEGSNCFPARWVDYSQPYKFRSLDACRAGIARARRANAINRDYHLDGRPLFGDTEYEEEPQCFVKQSPTWEPAERS